MWRYRRRESRKSRNGISVEEPLEKTGEIDFKVGGKKVMMYYEKG